MNDASRRALRTLAQFVVAGGFTAMVDAYIVGLDTGEKATVLAVAQLVVTFAQNYLEDLGSIPAIGKAKASDGAEPVVVGPER
ncbi:MAG: hypothetical protein M3Q71_15860 [Chloroflexota bacterium]|nr:hypothetical protein [Chloroflexota bacterium]